MFNKINIVVASTHSINEMQGYVDTLQNTCGCENEIYFIENKEGVGLSQLYEDMTMKINDSVIVFIHDDIVILNKGWGKELLRMFNEHKDYGIIGVAGTKKFTDSCVWWEDNKYCYGQVLHEKDGKQFLTCFSDLYNHDLEEVCVIDGVFMAIAQNRLGAGFDKNVSGFHFYDINFCLDNYLSEKCKIGVTTKIRLLHKSVGNPNQSWMMAREVAKNKYKNKLPIIIKP